MELTEEITISVDAEAAKVYRLASSEDKQKIQLLFSIWLKEMMREKKPASLKKLMDQISQKAQKRGLTPEILEEILRENPA
ncbi:MAG: hypothetical protein D6732_01600 [Methanobacteriota archaeon]|nr:MAG: hypothetical protein D6732_01600 [Euryarchaeota archaeon]